MANLLPKFCSKWLWICQVAKSQIQGVPNMDHWVIFILDFRHFVSFFHKQETLRLFGAGGNVNHHGGHKQ